VKIKEIERRERERERERDRAWRRQQATYQTLGWAVVLVIVIAILGAAFWPLWLLAFPAGWHLSSEARKIRSGAYDDD